MADGNLVRLGGIFGLLSVVIMIPAYLVGSPDVPGSPEQAGSYFEAGLGTFVFSNGVLPLFHIFFFILFLGVLYGLLRGAEEGDRGAAGGGVRGALPAAALAGGILFAALEAAGFAAEILFPAALQRFGVFEPDAAFVLVAVPLLPDRGVGYGTSHLSGGVENRCTAEMASPGGLRGRTADALARLVGACGWPSEITMDSSGLSADACRWHWGATGGPRRRTVHR